MGEIVQFRKSLKINVIEIFSNGAAAPKESLRWSEGNILKTLILEAIILHTLFIALLFIFIFSPLWALKSLWFCHQHLTSIARSNTTNEMMAKRNDNLSSNIRCRRGVPAHKSLFTSAVRAHFHLRKWLGLKCQFRRTKKGPPWTITLSK